MSKLKDLAVAAAPTFKCLIPSTGKTVKLRTFLVKEQKLLLMAKESEGDSGEAIVTAVMQLLQNCVLDDLIIANLPSFDVEYMFVQLFRNSTASKTSVSHYQCRAHKHDAEGKPVLTEEGEPVLCNAINKVTIDLSKAKVDPNTIKTGIITVGADNLDKLILKYPSFDQMTQIESNLASDKLDNVFKTYASCLTHIYKTDGVIWALGEDYTIEEGVEFLEYLSSEVFEQITEFFTEAPTVTSTVEFKCSECGNAGELNLSGLEDFF